MTELNWLIANTSEHCPCARPSPHHTSATSSLPTAPQGLQRPSAELSLRGGRRLGSGAARWGHTGWSASGTHRLNHTAPWGKSSWHTLRCWFKNTFISALIFKIYFLLLTLGFLISSFSSCFRCTVRLFIWLFLVSWGKPVMLWTFTLALLVQCPISFGLLCFHFHSFLCIFWFLLWFSGYSEVRYLASICLNF